MAIRKRFSALVSSLKDKKGKGKGKEESDNNAKKEDQINPKLSLFQRSTQPANKIENPTAGELPLNLPESNSPIIGNEKAELERAALRGNEALVKRILSKSPDRSIANGSARGYFTYPAIVAAAKNGHERVLRLLLREGGELIPHFNNGWEPLWKSVIGGQETSIEILLEVNWPMVWLDQLLLKAVEHNQAAITRLLIEKGGNVNAQLGDTRILSNVAGLGNENAVKLLLANGADIECKDLSQKTALHSAASRGKEEVMRLLLEHGANTKAKNDKGETPLHLASAKGHLECVKVLIEHGANCNARNAAGLTAVSGAGYGGHEEIVKLLLSNGAKIKVKNGREVPVLPLRSRNGVVLGGDRMRSSMAEAAASRDSPYIDPAILRWD
jgi:ankyrin repeat protein